MHFSLSVSSVCHVATGKHKPKRPPITIAVNTLPPHSAPFSKVKCPLYLKPYLQRICTNQCRNLSSTGIQIPRPLRQEQSAVRTTTIILHVFHSTFPRRMETQVTTCFRVFTSVVVYNWLVPTIRKKTHTASISKRPNLVRQDAEVFWASKSFD
jgi:hypothetical protein